MNALKLGLEGLHSARRGDCRVIYRIDDHRRRVDVLAIEHRSDIGATVWRIPLAG